MENKEQAIVLKCEDASVHPNQAARNTYWIRPSLRELLDETNRRYGAMLKRLAE